MSAWATSMFSFCSVMRRALGSFKVTSFRQSNGKTQLELPVPDLPLLSLLHEREGFMQTASVKWIGKQRFVASSPSGHAIPLDSDRESSGMAWPDGLLATNLCLPIHFTDAVCMKPSLS